MHLQKRAMLGINVVGGLAVLGSYAYGILTHYNPGTALWGGVPERLRPVYTANMPLAALGYLALTYRLLVRTDPEEARVARWSGLWLFNVLYVAILVPSALWMPLTFAMVERPGNLMWAGIRIVLSLVGLASLGLLAALLGLQPRRPHWIHWLSVVGAVLFCLQTAVLDALVWTAYFRR